MVPISGGQHAGEGQPFGWELWCVAQELLESCLSRVAARDARQSVVRAEFGANHDERGRRLPSCRLPLTLTRSTHTHKAHCILHCTLCALSKAPTASSAVNLEGHQWARLTLLHEFVGGEKALSAHFFLLQCNSLPLFQRNIWPANKRRRLSLVCCGAVCKRVQLGG